MNASTDVPLLSPFMPLLPIGQIYDSMKKNIRARADEFVGVVSDFVRPNGSMNEQFSRYVSVPLSLLFLALLKGRNLV
jgi:hypothetical protein